MSSDCKSTSYDNVPYSSTAFPQTHPDRLFVMAKLFGLEPAPPGRCRLLELGSASGGNIIPMACELPESHFIGIDLSARQIAEGQSKIGSLHLNNIELLQLSITDVGSELGIFDYIVCHGVYSWVPDAVRESILRVCRDHLSPDGVAYVSYNTYPGWHMRGMIRDMMRYHSGRFNEPKAQIEQARSLLNFLATSVSVDTPYGMMLRRELEELQQQPDYYLYHEHLEDVNNPIYFFQFAQQIEKNGLQFLGEADFSTMLSSNFHPKVAEVLQRIANDIIHMEQYMDFLRNRTFRQSLLVRRDRKLHRNLTFTKVKPFYLASQARAVSAAPNIRSHNPEEFCVPSGMTMKTSHPLTKAAMTLMAESWPKPLHFNEIVNQAHFKLNPASNLKMSLNDPVVEILASEILSAYTTGMVELRPRGLDFTRQPNTLPVASRLSRFQAEQNPHARIVNLRHEPIRLDEFKRQIIMRLDGMHDKEKLLSELGNLVRTGALKIEQNQKKITDPNVLLPLLEKLIGEALSALASMALIER